MKKDIKNKKTINKCVCDNDPYFQRSDEQFRAKLNDTEFSTEYNHFDYEGIVEEDQFYLNNNEENYFNENEKGYSIYDYDIENNQGHEWGNKKR